MKYRQYRKAGEAEPIATVAEELFAVIENYLLQSGPVEWRGLNYGQAWQPVDGKPIELPQDPAWVYKAWGEGKEGPLKTTGACPIWTINLNPPPGQYKKAVLSLEFEPDCSSWSASTDLRDLAWCVLRRDDENKNKLQVCSLRCRRLNNTLVVIAQHGIGVGKKEKARARLEGQRPEKHAYRLRVDHRAPVYVLSLAVDDTVMAGDTPQGDYATAIDVTNEGIHLQLGGYHPTADNLAAPGVYRNVKIEFWK